MKKGQKAKSGIRKAENRISDCGWGIADGGMRSPEIGNQKQPLRSQRLSGKNGPAEQGPTEWRKLEGSVGPRSAAAKRSAAFTLIELLGVMAIIGILAAVTLPSMIGRIESARIQSEDANLEEIAKALVEGIQKRGQFPDPGLPIGSPEAWTPGSWTDIAQSFTSLSPDALSSVLPIGNERRIVFSADLTAYLGGVFDTPADGWGPPPANASLIIYILSSSKNGVPLSTGVIPPADISNWNKAFDDGLGYIPAPASVLGAGNVNKGEFLHVKAVNLRPLFCRVELIDTACPPTAQIENGASYNIGDTIVLNFAGAGCQFSFTAVAAGAFTAGAPISGSIGASTPLMLKKPFANIVINDPGPPAPNGARISENPANLAGNGAQATLSPALPPQFQINGLLANPFGASNTEVFYVLKGTSLSLLDNAGITLITLTVQADSIFKYFNSTWSRVD